MRQPTLADVPGILWRTFARLIARIVFTAAGGVLLAGFALAYLSILIATFRSTRRPRGQIIVDWLLATYALWQSYSVSDSD